MAKEKGFDKAYAELRKIVDELNADDISIDKLGEKMKKARELLKITKEKLRNVESDIESILESE